MKTSRMLLAVALLLTGAGTAQAALVASSDGSMVFDTDLNITWLANANLASTNTFGLPTNVDLGPNPGVNSYGGSYIYSGNLWTSGRMTWGGALKWIAAMNAAHYLGYNDWRLPTSDSCGMNTVETGNCSGSEMGHLFYNELGGHALAYLNTTTNPNLALFSNLDTNFGYYWSGTQSIDYPFYGAFYFDFRFGQQSDGYTKDNQMYAMAVRSGGFSSVPIPAAFWLFGSSLLGLTGLARKSKARCILLSITAIFGSPFLFPRSRDGFI